MDMSANVASLRPLQRHDIDRRVRDKEDNIMTNQEQTQYERLQLSNRADASTAQVSNATDDQSLLTPIPVTT